jgi:hypothetical protein
MLVEETPTLRTGEQAYDARSRGRVSRALAHEAARAQRLADFFEDRATDPLMQGPPGMAHLILAVAIEMAHKRGLGDLTAGRRRLATWMRSISELPSMRRTVPPQVALSIKPATRNPTSLTRGPLRRRRYSNWRRS